MGDSQDEDGLVIVYVRVGERLQRLRHGVDDFLVTDAAFGGQGSKEALFPELFAVPVTGLGDAVGVEHEAFGWTQVEVTCLQVRTADNAEEGSVARDGPRNVRVAEVEREGVARADEGEVESTVGVGGEVAVDEGDEAGSVTVGAVEERFVDRLDDGFRSRQQGRLRHGRCDGRARWW